jgi:hypothetical protein
MCLVLYLASWEQFSPRTCKVDKTSPTTCKPGTVWSKLVKFERIQLKLNRFSFGLKCLQKDPWNSFLWTAPTCWKVYEKHLESLFVQTEMVPHEI